jgi:ribosomal-protein-alanine N-acetyltransferase
MYFYPWYGCNINVDMDHITIQEATEKDLAQIIEIEKVSFPSPWNINTFISTLHDHRCKNIVACFKGEAVGYSFALTMKTMVHLLNLAVHPNHRKKGIAKRLLNEIISYARQCNKSYVFLEVRKSNEQARCLYESAGFSHVSTWPKYYTDTREDADVMVKRLEGEGR